MIDISVSRLVKAFEVGKNILDGLSFEINAGERVGLLGSNGAGKTTLFRILTDELSSDEGDVVIAPSKRLGLISQIPKYPEGWTVERVLKSAFSRLDSLRRSMEEMEREMESGRSDSALLRRYDEALAAYESAGGYDSDVALLRVANGLSIGEKMRSQDFASLSGGEKTRVNLARLILEDTDILLLDEPTNHLDMNSVEWLEEYLQKFRGTVLTISHDRWFLDRVVGRILELDGGKITEYNGNYSFYIREKQARFEEQMRRYEKDQAKIKQLQEAADKLHLWAFMGNDKLHKRAFSMEKRIERLEQTERPKTAKKMRARFNEREFRADEVMVVDSLAKGFDGKTLFRDFSAGVTGGERIALIGDNGTGKSTLVRLIMGEELPDSGSVRTGPSVKLGYLPQLVHFEHPERSVLDTMLYELGLSHQAARDRLGAFMFRGEDVFKPVSALSGGEQSRLRLCMLMNGEINLLVLDEPTNHLDLASREWIEAALEDYGEALLLISHDRYFISKYATRIWRIENGEITDFRGDFEEFRVWDARRREFAQTAKNVQKKKAAPSREKPQRGGQKQLEREIAKVEREIAALESEIQRLDTEMEVCASDYIKLGELMEERASVEAALDSAMERWTELMES